jgi:DNA-binding response OmpR family regulator
MIRSLVRRLVTRDGMEPILMEKGEKALRWLRDHMDVDAIILDLMMPGLDGFTVMKMARAQGYEGPIIIISSLHSNDIREQALRDGAVHFINKSTDMHLIPTVLNQLKRAAAMYHEKRMKNKGSTTLAQSADDVFDVELGGSMPDPFSD